MHYASCSVGQNEINLLCGEAAVKTTRENLLKYAPKLLYYGGHAVPQSIEEHLMKVMETIGKCLRGSGPGAKAPGVYSLYEISLTESELVGIELFNLFLLYRLA